MSNEQKDASSNQPNRRYEMGLNQIYTTQSAHAEPNKKDEAASVAYCNCLKKNRIWKMPMEIPVICHCGEDVCRTMDWTWDEHFKQPQTIVNGASVAFHPSYSQGTSLVRGNRELQKKRIHYWEVKVDSWFPGTDLMVGIGTEKVDVAEHRYKFSSILGLDSQSWGYSFRGMIQHKGVFKYYGSPFGTHSIIGVRLDLCKGQLEFLLNRRPLGIAYKNIPVDSNTVLYPMVASTSAKSSIRLINASSSAESLQFQCMAVISKYSSLLQIAKKTPGLSLLCREFWHLQPKERYKFNNRIDDNCLLNDIEPTIDGCDLDEYFIA